jgi:hypothetical protein
MMARQQDQDVPELAADIIAHRLRIGHPDGLRRADLTQQRSPDTGTG